MMKTPVVKESTQYENLVEQVPELLRDSQPPKPNDVSDPYPFTLKVHTWTLGDTEKFTQLMGLPLSSDDYRFTYKKKHKFKPKDCVFTELRQNPFKKRTTHLERLETKLWENTLEFVQDGWNPYITFEVTFTDEDHFIHYCRRTKQRLSLNSPSTTFPTRKQKIYRMGWRSKWDDHNPKYPIYIVSKGRGDSRVTSKCLERLGIPYYIVIEPQDYDEYSCMIEKEKILVLPFSNHGDGPGRSRNWCWDHSMSMGFKRHWVMDDNIRDFYRLHRNKIQPITDGGLFRVCEEFVDRFRNIPVSGLQYDFFTVDKSPYPPFVLNTRIYSCLLIENSCPYRWRGRYNEDTILSLDVLKDGMCTLQFNILLQGKMGTQILSGGNTGEFYGREGTYNKSKMLEMIHPDVCKTVWRYGRYHHHCDYSPFKTNEPKYVEGYDPNHNRDETDLFQMEKTRIERIKGR